MNPLPTNAEIREWEAVATEEERNELTLLVTQRLKRAMTDFEGNPYGTNYSVLEAAMLAYQHVKKNLKVGVPKKIENSQAASGK